MPERIPQYKNKNTMPKWAREKPKKGRERYHGIYNNHHWRKARKEFLKDNPLCAECDKYGRLTAANTVDHIKPHRGDMDLFWDVSNWQALCKRCHDLKTGRGE